MQVAKPQSQPVYHHKLTFANGAVVSADAVLKGNITVSEGEGVIQVGLLETDVLIVVSSGSVLHNFCQVLAHRGTITIGPNCNIQEDAIIECQ